MRFSSFRRSWIPEVPVWEVMNVHLVHGWVIAESWWRGLFQGASLAQSERWARRGDGLAVGFAPRPCRAKLVVFGGILMDNVHLVVLVQSTDGSSRNRGGAACFRALPWLSRSVGHAGAMVWR